MEFGIETGRLGRGGACIRRSRASALLPLLMVAACSGRTGPEVSPVASVADDQRVAEAPPPTMAEVVSESLDDWRTDEAPGFQDDVLELDEVSRRQFYHLYGSDPLGLSSTPVNVARYEIPLETNEHVEACVSWSLVAATCTRFRIYMERSGAYEEMIRQRLRDAEMPEDLLYLAMIESGMNPNAARRSCAVGLWQFIKFA